MQNWYPGDAEGKGGIFNFVTKRGDCRGARSKISWTQVETGSAITWKYPSCILRGDNSRGEFYSIAISNGHQQVDSGTKMLHLGKNTTSRIISKGIAAGKSNNTYRGLVTAHRKAKGARNFTNCDSLLIGDQCGAHTVPYIEAKNSSAVFEHEATTSKISEDMLFYCRQRGMSAEEATALVVNGFVKDVLQQLPMEFAVEAQKLISISLKERRLSSTHCKRSTVGDAQRWELATVARHFPDRGYARTSLIVKRQRSGGAPRRCDVSSNLAPTNDRWRRRRSHADQMTIQLRLRMSFLEVKNLHVEVEDKKILNGLTLTVEKGQVAAIMGPNGSGKSTLAYVLAGKDNYKVTEGDVLLDGESILDMAPDERAAKGVFLAFQYPVEVPGVATMTFLRTALNAQRKTRGEAELSTPEFMKLVRETARPARHQPGNAAPRGQCRLFRRREEAQRDLADGGPAAAACGARRDRFRPRHRRAQDRGRGRQPACARPSARWS